MAAAVLLLLLFCSIQAELILRAGVNHIFMWRGPADFCSVYRWTGEAKQLLWNSTNTYYQLSPLEVSHSGRYQVQCWTRGDVTYERNSSLLVCDDQKMKDHGTLYLVIGQTAELTCGAVGPNQSVQWAFWKYGAAGLARIDEAMPSLRVQNTSLLLTADRQLSGVAYFCLERRPLGCVLHSRVSVVVPSESVIRSVGESLELNCSDGSGNRTRGWRMENAAGTEIESLNATLVLPSLTLAHSGLYTCAPREVYHVFVCPEPEPPAVELFTGGEDLTLRCGDWTGYVRWFMRSNRTKGRVFNVEEFRLPEIHHSDRGLVIRNVSLEDSGEFRCVIKRGHFCQFQAETLVMFGQREVDQLLLRSVLLSVAALLVLCVVVGVVVWRRRRRARLPAPVEEQEVAQLSPESEPA